jgi:hypothetical protein
VGKKLKEAGLVELTDRKTGNTEELPPGELLSKLGLMS